MLNHLHHSLYRLHQQWICHVVMLALWLLLLGGFSLAQVNTTDISTASGIASGSPAGSSALGELESVNLYNGNLNFKLPLLQIGGRGAAGYAMTLALNTKGWRVQQIYDRINDTYKYRPTQNWWSLTAGLGPGVLSGRQMGVDYSPNACYRDAHNNNLDWPHNGITTLTFTAPDGTEYELRDKNTNGQPLPAPNCNTGASRGTVFVTTDGSSLTFVADSPIVDQVVKAAQTIYPSGYLLFRDGTRYRIVNGQVTLISDRNGNKVSFAYDAGLHQTTITDQLNRQVTVTTSDTQSVINYNGVSGAARTITVNYTLLENALRPNSGYAKQTDGQLFPELYTLGPPDVSINYNHNPTVVSSVILPDGIRKYQFFYNSYGEIARVVLPTGGAIEYDMVSGSGVVSKPGTDDYEIYRRVAERRLYPNGGMGSAFESKTTYVASASAPGAARPWYTNVTVEHFDHVGGTPLAREKHYFYGSGVASLFKFFTTPTAAETYTPWNEGREYQTEAIDPGGSGTNVLRRASNTWRQQAPVSWWTGNTDLAPANDPRLVETTTVLEPSAINLVAKTTAIDPRDPTGQTVGFDQYNNPTDVWEYGYGTGVASTYALRHTHTDYLTTNPANGIDYTADTGAHIRSLPTGQQVYAVSATNGAETLVAQGTTSYDEVAYPLLTYATVVGWNDPGTAARGLATTSSRWVDTTNTWLATHAQYDQVGNVRKTWDAREDKQEEERVTEVKYDDHFSGINPAPPPTYAFPTSTTSTVPDLSNNRATNSPLTTATVYDYSTGHITESTDANGQVTRADYSDDLLDRLKLVTRPDGGRTQYFYNDTVGSVSLRTLTDQDATRSVETYQFFDGLGRGVRSFLNVGGAPTQFSTTDAQYDALGRAWRVSNPYLTSGLNDPVNPSGKWTTTAYDALGRVKTVTTPDYAVVGTAYSGNTVTVTDQKGKQRKSMTDALGRLVSVTEAPNDPNYNYQTSYDYDALGNLRQVKQDQPANAQYPQGVQQRRYFMYDSLSRLIRAKNPEQLVNTSLDTSADPVSYNTHWAMAYSYDANGNLATKIDARGVTTSYLYDNLNRVKQTSYSDSTALTLNTYDFATNGRGRFYADYESSETGTINYVKVYDAVGRPTTRQTRFHVSGETWASFDSTREYDKAGHVKQETYPSEHTVNYNYDAAGRLGDNGSNLALTGNLGDGVTRTYAQAVSYDEASRMQQEQFGTTVPLYHKLHYNVRGQLYDIRLSTVNWQTDPLNWNRGCLTAYYDSAYHWGGAGGQDSGPDNNGNVTRMQHWVPGDDQASTYSLSDDYYDYDPLNRLKSDSEYYEGTGQARTQKFVQTYNYDQWGNRTINTGATWGTGINNTPFTVDAATNQLQPDGTGTISYDKAGNQTYDNYSTGTAAVKRFYDAENRLTETQNAGDQPVSKYTYDAAGKRMRRETGGTVTWQVYGFDGELVAEYAANAAPTAPQKEYGYRSGELLIVAESATLPLSAGSTNLSVNATSDTEINLSWSGVAGATNYRVERSTSKVGQYTVAGNTTATSFSDGNVSRGLAYLYKVCAANGAGQCLSPYSNIALGTAYSFLDPQIITFAEDPSGLSVTSIKAQHLTQLREVVGAVRVLAGRAPATWAHPTLTPGQTQISAIDVQELRTQLDEALTDLGITTTAYTDPDLGPVPTGVLIRKVHIMQLRARATQGSAAVGTGDNSSTAARMQWLVSDQLGTPRMVADLSGSLSGIKRHDYLPFGEEVGAGVGGRTQAQGYVQDNVRQKFGGGHERDNETGLDFMQARYYSSTMGRFTSPDSFFGKITNPQTLNLYAYVRNNPLKYIDPTGHIAQDPKKDDPIPVNPLVVPVPCESCTAKVGEFHIIPPKQSQSELPPSLLDWLPVVGNFRHFLYERQQHNFGRAIGYFFLTAIDGGTMGESFLLKQAGKQAAERVILREALEEADVTASRVLVDSNVVPQLRADPTAAGRILPGEQSVVSYVTGPELRNAVSTGNLRGVPGNLGSLEVLYARPSLDLRITIRGMLPAGRGRFGDGIIGAQAIGRGLPLVTNDRALANSVRALGGIVR